MMITIVVSRFLFLVGLYAGMPCDSKKVMGLNIKLPKNSIKSPLDRRRNPVYSAFS